MNPQFFSSCCRQHTAPAEFPFKPLNTEHLSTTKSSNRLRIFSPKNDFGLSTKNPFSLTPKERELKELISYENHLRQRMREVNMLYEKEIKPLEEDCARYREMNLERNQQIANVNTRLRAVENGYVNYN